MGHKKKRILVFIDVPNWSADFTCSYVIERLKNEFTFVKRTLPYQLIRGDQNFDLVYLHCSFTFGRLLRCMRKSRVHKYKTKFAAGVRGHYGYQNAIGQLQQFDALNTSSRLLLNIVKDRFPRKKVFLCHAGVDCFMFKKLRTRGAAAPFVVGWAGNSRNKAKRVERLKLLKLPLKVADPKGAYGGKKYRHDKMPKFYNSIDALVLCSDVEGCPRPPMEAAACEVPVVSFPVGAIQEWLPEHWQVKNTTEMRARLLELKRNVALRRRVGKQLRAIMLKNWRWDIVISEYRRFFNGVLNEK